jgi:hypothetical protein
MGQALGGLWCFEEHAKFQFIGFGWHLDVFTSIDPSLQKTSQCVFQLPAGTDLVQLALSAEVRGIFLLCRVRGGDDGGSVLSVSENTWRTHRTGSTYTPAVHQGRRMGPLRGPARLAKWPKYRNQAVTQRSPNGVMMGTYFMPSSTNSRAAPRCNVLGI